MLPFTLQQLRILKAVATEKNFTKAAERVHLSQPALSASIQRLEDEVGSRLFHRGRKGAELTEVGIALLPLARQMSQTWMDCQRVAASNGLDAGFANCLVLIGLNSGDEPHTAMARATRATVAELYPHVLGSHSGLDGAMS